MPDDALKPALRAALRSNEIGDGSPYRLAFAGTGRSGASFGFMQGDMATGPRIVQRSFGAAMTRAGMPPETADALRRRLSVHLAENPLSQDEHARVDAALLASALLVDAMDEVLLGHVYAGLDTCVTAAGAAGRCILPLGQLYFSLWINMTGAPSSVLRWLAGEDPHLARPIPPAPSVVNGAAARCYLAATSYFAALPGALAHLDQSVAAGERMLSMPRASAPAQELIGA